MLFAYPADFDPVSTTELGYLVSKKEKFKDRNVKCIALSCYPVRSHHIWIEDIRAYSHMSRSDRFPYPIISDPDRDICGHLGILNLMDSEDGRQLADRAVSLFSSCIYRGECNPTYNYIHYAFMLTCLLGQFCMRAELII